MSKTPQKHTEGSESPPFLAAVAALATIDDTVRAARSPGAPPA
ncbi:hypothetical protein AB0K51_13160 [Kitasatospora sp. NPDC049285]